MNYVFYDFETSGLDPYFDQPIQLAAKLVDSNFNTLDEFDEKCRLRDGVIPSPFAMLITKTNLEDLDAEQSFYKFMDKTHEKLSSWSPAIFIGYNNINFDEKFLRSSLYQSLYAPYLTNTNSNSRVDLFKMILAVCNLNKKYLNIPIDIENGRKSLKLEKLAINNKIKHEFAHDAMSDVNATVDLANIIKENEPDLWEYMILFRNHKNVTDFVQENNIIIIPPTHATGKYTPACYVTSNPDNAKEMIFYNLDEDINEDILNSRTRSIGALLKNKVLKKIKSNDYPILLKENHLDESGQREFREKKKLYEERAKLIITSSNFVMNINQFLVDQLADYQVDNRDYMQASEHVDELLYSGFTGPSDWQTIKQLDSLKNTNDILTKLNTLEDKRLVELYKRKMYSENIDLLPKEFINKHKEYIMNKISTDEEKIRWTSLIKARNDLKKANDDERFSEMHKEIKNIENYLNKIENKFL
tara:strand:- start:1386 stop:2804 length:1419 start_codon:yes stop_codon:yes gene_type:complete